MNGNILSTLWPRTQAQPLNKVVLVGLGVLLLAASAKVQVPFWPVPMTLQTAVVLLIGVTYGARLAASTLASYLAAGAVGLPVFAAGAGIAYMVGPTGGYLAGFLVAAAVTGWLADKGYGRTGLSALAVFAVGEVLIFALGVGWLAGLFGAEKAIAAGLLPFIPAELLKIALASATVVIIWKQVKR